MVDQVKNFMIGLFVLAALAIIVFILLFLHPSVGDEQRELRVLFADVDKLSVGTRVTFAGKPVGEVVAINEVPGADHFRSAHDGRVYVYELILKIDSGVNVYKTDTIAARTSGLLGEKSVAIIPRPLPSGEQLVLVNNDVVFAEESGSVEETFKDFSKIADKFSKLLDDLSSSIETMNKEKMWDSLNDTIKNLDSITTAINKPKELSETLTNLHRLSEKANRSWKKVDESLDHLVKTSADANQIIASIRAGEGTIGRLVATEDLYLRLNAILSKADVTMNDINHYGLLFHSDKGWQRLRARRMNLLTKLQCPQEFRNYFNDEVDQIFTSLGRVTSVLDETEGTCPPFALAENRDFSKVFAELLRRVKELEESLNMYNQQLIDASVCETEINNVCN